METARGNLEAAQGNLETARGELNAANGAVSQTQVVLDTCTAAAAKKPELEAGLTAARNGLAQAEEKRQSWFRQLRL